MTKKATPKKPTQVKKPTTGLHLTECEVLTLLKTGKALTRGDIRKALNGKSVGKLLGRKDEIRRAAIEQATGRKSLIARKFVKQDVDDVDEKTIITFTITKAGLAALKKK